MSIYIYSCVHICVHHPADRCFVSRESGAKTVDKVDCLVSKMDESGGNSPVAMVKKTKQRTSCDDRGNNKKCER